MTVIHYSQINDSCVSHLFIVNQKHAGVQIYETNESQVLILLSESNMYLRHVDFWKKYDSFVYELVLFSDSNACRQPV